MTEPMDRWRDYDRTIISLGYDAARRDRARANAPAYVQALRDGTAWERFGDAVKVLGSKLMASEFARTDIERGEGYRYLMNMVAARLNGVLYACGPDKPAFVRGMDDILKVGLDNPDGINSFAARVDADGAYRLTGIAGGERYVEFVQTGSKGTLANHYLHDFTIGDDGRFEIIASREPSSGNWLPLHADVQGIYVRLIHYDWNAPTTQLHIERIGETGVYECLRTPDPAEVAEELESLASTLLAEVDFWLDYTRSFAKGGVNRIAGEQPLATSGLSQVRAAPKGIFELNPEEALLLEFDDPGGLFWSVSLGDIWFRTIDPSYHQSSLNGAQAIPDPDGRYRVVVAHADPGFANWLDTTGHPRGCLTFRYVKTEQRPAVKTTVVRVEEIGAHMVDGAARCSPEARAATVAERARGFANRYASPFTSRWRRV